MPTDIAKYSIKLFNQGAGIGEVLDRHAKTPSLWRVRWY
jgi:hypothetical protein